MQTPVPEARTASRGSCLLSLVASAIVGVMAASHRGPPSPLVIWASAASCFGFTSSCIQIFIIDSDEMSAIRPASTTTMLFHIYVMCAAMVCSAVAMFEVENDPTRTTWIAALGLMMVSALAAVMTGFDWYKRTKHSREQRTIE